MRIFQKIWRMWLKPFQTLGAIVTYQMQPPPMTEFVDYDGYWARRGVPSVIYRRWIITADAMADGRSVLDIGCGSGGFLAYLKQRRPNMRISVGDISPAAVERARQAGADAFVHDLQQGRRRAPTTTSPASKCWSISPKLKRHFAA